jgi:hypothetical protein
LRVHKPAKPFSAVLGEAQKQLTNEDNRNFLEQVLNAARGRSTD